jgi:hypothetical protein
MNLSSVPHTVGYEIKKLQEKLEEIDKEITANLSDREEIVNFSWMQFRRTREEIERELHYLNQLFLPESPDPTIA